MARRTDELVRSWSSLSSRDEASGWRTIAITNAGGCLLRAGRRFPGDQEALLVRFPGSLSPHPDLPQGHGFSVDLVSLDGATWVALSRKAAGTADMFLAMACDVARVLEKASASSHLLPTFISRIRSWQEFMRTGGRALGPVEEVGLYGELAVLRALVEEGVLATTAVGAWLGPVGGVQDFHLATGAIEVKSTLASKGFVARISSLEQLDDGLRQPLYLCGVRLRQVESDGRTLTGLVEQLRSLVASDAESARVLDDRLLAAGYHDAHAGEYARAFSVQDVLLLQVSDVFPRLTAGRVPRAIVHASYDVDLEYCGVASVDLKAALTKLGAICT